MKEANVEPRETRDKHPIYPALRGTSNAQRRMEEQTAEDDLSAVALFAYGRRQRRVNLGDQGAVLRSK